MKFIIKGTQAPEKLIAVLGADKNCLFFNGPDSVYYLSVDGRLYRQVGYTLEQLAKDKGRTPFYEGDSVTLEF